MTPPLQLSQQQAREILRLAGLSSQTDVTALQEQNHIWRLQGPDGNFYLKTYSKDWYGGDVPRTAGCVEHEAIAYAILASHGIPGPEVVLACPDMTNPLGRPVLLLRELDATSLVPLLHRSEPREFRTMLETVGAFLLVYEEMVSRTARSRWLLLSFTHCSWS